MNDLKETKRDNIYKIVFRKCKEPVLKIANPPIHITLALLGFILEFIIELPFLAIFLVNNYFSKTERKKSA